MQNLKMWKLIAQTSVTRKSFGKPQLPQGGVYPSLKMTDIQDSCLPPSPLLTPSLKYVLLKS